ncbi:LPXTG cell wall anchor domain-containing protein [Streptomyces sp. NPDC058326]|uniref:LPXTG cell wall anchor domain-containing protein n=1 Tax=Streptomyces sp. NPDC058326 TaxID=3346447 RepID=UPI0036E43E11
MPAARRRLLTATVAGTLLCALWFVPSANATDERGGVRIGVIQDAPAGGGGRLAETGGRNTTSYLLGGAGFLGVGAGFVALAMRRRGRAF